jgi:uncharacterized membrane protein
MRWTDTISIQAPAEVVWRLTAGIADWPSFLSTMQRIEPLEAGPLRVGSSAKVKQPRQTEAVWTVTRLEPGREFTWRTARLGLEMVGSHLVEEDAGGCRNTLILDVTGPASRPFGWVFGPVLRRSLRDENAGFKRKAEDSTPTDT